MKNTSGKKFRKKIKYGILIALVLSIYLGQRSSMRKLVAHARKDPTLGQYLNRLIEFFDTANIDYAEDEFMYLVHFGVYPHEAFDIITSDRDKIDRPVCS